MRPALVDMLIAARAALYPSRPQTVSEPEPECPPIPWSILWTEDDAIDSEAE